MFQRNWHYLNRPYDLHLWYIFDKHIHVYIWSVSWEWHQKYYVFKIKKHNGYQFFLLSMGLMCRTALLLRKWFNLWKVVLCIKLVMSESLSFSTKSHEWKSFLSQQLSWCKNSITHMILCTVLFCLPILLVSISFEEQMYNLNNITSQPNWALVLLFLWHSFMPKFCTVVDLTSGFVNIWFCCMLKINVAFSNYWEKTAKTAISLDPDLFAQLNPFTTKKIET